MLIGFCDAADVGMTDVLVLLPQVVTLPTAARTLCQEVLATVASERGLDPSEIHTADLVYNSQSVVDYASVKSLQDRRSVVEQRGLSMSLPGGSCDLSRYKRFLFIDDAVVSGATYEAAACLLQERHGVEAHKIWAICILRIQGLPMNYESRLNLSGFGHIDMNEFMASTLSSAYEEEGLWMVVQRLLRCICSHISKDTTHAMNLLKFFPADRRHRFFRRLLCDIDMDKLSASFPSAVSSLMAASEELMCDQLC